MIINDLDDYYIVFDTKNRNTELDALFSCLVVCHVKTLNKITKQQNHQTTSSNIDIYYLGGHN